MDTTKLTPGDKLRLVRNYQTMDAECGATATFLGFHEAHGNNYVTVKWDRSDGLARGQMDGIYDPDSFEVVEDVFSSPLDTQVGGEHYSGRKIQPIEYIMANNLGFCEGNVVKYITRYKDKGGLEDLHKARHYIDFLIADIEEQYHAGDQ